MSTVSVYADNARPDSARTPRRCEYRPRRRSSAAPRRSTAPAKVACEQAVGDDAFICRAGLIAGPEDPTGRFTYWPVRLARGGEVLVPDRRTTRPADRRARSCAVDRACGADRPEGDFDAIGPSCTRGEFLAQCAGAVGADCSFVWVDRAFLERHDVKRWAGPRSLPLWLPLPEFAGFSTRDTSPALAAGLTLRPLAETARDTLRWVRASGGPISGSDRRRGARAAGRVASEGEIVASPKCDARNSSARTNSRLSFR